LSGIKEGISRHLVNRNSVAITGASIGLFSLTFGWLTLKSSRLAAGTSLRLWEAVGWEGAALLLVLWHACLFLSLSGKSRRRAIIENKRYKSKWKLLFVPGFISNDKLKIQ